MRVQAHQPFMAMSLKPVENQALPMFGLRQSAHDSFQTRFSGEAIKLADLYEARSKTFQVPRPDGGALRMRRWETSEAALAKCPTTGPPILLVHGGNSRSAWMSPLGWFLADKKPAVYGLDIKNVGYTDTPDHVGRINRYQDLVSEVRDAVIWLSKTHEQPVFIIAHSMGGTISSLLASDPPLDEHGEERIKGMVLLAPAFDYAPGTLSAGFNTTYYSRLAMERVGLKPKPIALPPSHTLDALTSNAEKHRLILESEDRVNHYTPGSWSEMHKLMKANRKKAANVKVSTLVVVPRHDKIADPAAMRRVYKDYTSLDKQIVFLDKVNGVPVKHDVLWEESVRDDVAQVINRWLTARSVAIHPDGR